MKKILITTLALSLGGNMVAQDIDSKIVKIMDQLEKAANEIRQEIEDGIALEKSKKGQNYNISTAEKIDAEEARSEEGAILYLPIGDSYRVTSRYGYRSRPRSGASRFHKGIDLACPVNTRVFSILPGRVVKTGYSTSYGKYIIIDHGNDIRSLYAHLNYISTYKNAVVKGGQAIGGVGTTGITTGPHLHFEILQKWNRLDPEKYIKF